MQAVVRVTARAIVCFACDHKIKPSVIWTVLFGGHINPEFVYNFSVSLTFKEIPSDKIRINSNLCS